MASRCVQHPHDPLFFGNANQVTGQYSWLTTCIYIAVLIVEYPTNWIIQRVPIAKYLGVNIVLWGAVLALHSVCKNFTGLVVVRTLLGIFEAVCQPTFVVLSSMWYTRGEQASTVTYWYDALALSHYFQLAEPSAGT